MAKKRVTRKQLLKEPDEFITTTGKLIAWAKENTQALVIGVAVFFGLIIVISVLGYIRQSRSLTAQMMFSQVVSRYQLEAGQKSQEEALSAVQEEFDAFIKSHGDEPAGRLGRIFFGHISLAGKAYDQAISHYQKAMDDLGDQSTLTNVILNGLASAHQQKGEVAPAIENFRKIVDGPGMMLKDVALFNLGQLYLRVEKHEESKKAYEQLSTEFPDSIYAEIVREKVPG